MKSYPVIFRHFTMKTVDPGTCQDEVHIWNVRVLLEIPWTCETNRSQVQEHDQRNASYPSPGIRG